MKSKIQIHKYRIGCIIFFFKFSPPHHRSKPLSHSTRLVGLSGFLSRGIAIPKQAQPPISTKAAGILQSNIAPRVNTPNIHTCYISLNVTYILQISYSSHSPHPGTWTHSCFHPLKASCAGPVVHPLPQLDEAKVGAAVRRFDKSVAKDLKTTTVMKRWGMGVSTFGPSTWWYRSYLVAGVAVTCVCRKDSVRITSYLYFGHVTWLNTCPKRIRPDLEIQSNRCCFGAAGIVGSYTGVNQKKHIRNPAVGRKFTMKADLLSFGPIGEGGFF